MRRIIAVQSCQNCKSEIETVEDILNNPAEYPNQEVRMQDIISQAIQAKNNLVLLEKKELYYEAENIRNIKNISTEE